MRHSERIGTKHPPLLALIAASKHILNVRRALRAALPMSSNSERTAGSNSSASSFKLQFATSDRKNQYHTVEQCIDEALIFLKSQHVCDNVPHKTRATMLAELHAAQEVLFVGRAVSNLATMLLRKRRSTKTLESNLAHDQMTPWAELRNLKRALQEVENSLLKQNSTSEVDPFLHRLIEVSHVMLALRNCVTQASGVDFGVEGSQQRRYKAGSSRVEAEHSSASRNDLEIESLAAKFVELVANCPLIGYLCSNEVEEAVSAVRERRSIALAVEHLRNASRAIRSDYGYEHKLLNFGEDRKDRATGIKMERGGGEALVALQAAVSRARRMRLDIHRNPRVVAHFTRSAHLLSEVTAVMDALRRGIKRQDQRELRLALQKAQRLGFVCVEVHAARAFLDEI